MKIIVPAYNVKPEQATRYEAQIAAIMHMERERELGLLKKKDPASEAGRVPRHTKPVKHTDIAIPKPLNPTDNMVLRVLAGRELTATEIADWISVSTDTARQALSKLYTRKLVSRSMRGSLVIWRAE